MRWSMKKTTIRVSSIQNEGSTLVFPESSSRLDESSVLVCWILITAAIFSTVIDCRIIVRARYDSVVANVTQFSFNRQVNSLCWRIFLRKKSKKKIMRARIRHKSCRTYADNRLIIVRPMKSVKALQRMSIVISMYSKKTMRVVLEEDMLDTYQQLSLLSLLHKSSWKLY